LLIWLVGWLNHTRIQPLDSSSYAGEAQVGEITEVRWNSCNAPHFIMPQDDQ
jgi:hypothetical protein